MNDFLKNIQQILSNVGQNPYVQRVVSNVNDYNTQQRNDMSAIRQYGFAGAPEDIRKRQIDNSLGMVMGMTSSVDINPNTLSSLKPVYRKSVENVLRIGGKMKMGEYLFNLKNKLLSMNPSSLEYKWLEPKYIEYSRDLLNYEDAIQKSLKSAFLKK